MSGTKIVGMNIVGIPSWAKQKPSGKQMSELDASPQYARATAEARARKVEWFIDGGWEQMHGEYVRNAPYSKSGPKSDVFHESPPSPSANSLRRRLTLVSSKATTTPLTSMPQLAFHNCSSRKGLV